MLHSAALARNSVVLVGGRPNMLAEGASTSRAVLRFKLNECTWSRLASCKHPHDMRPALCVFEQHGMLYALGGSSNKVANVLVERYSAETEQW